MRVLDNGYVELVSSMGNDLAIVNAARVSYNAIRREVLDSDIRLLKYLLINKHTSPFEHVVFTFNVKAPIFVFRQWQRHRTQSYNEVSARYTELEEDFYLPAPEVIGVQSKSSKQARDVVYTRSPQEIEYIQNYFKDIYSHSYRNYKTLMESYNVPRELARAVLPTAVYSKMYTTLNLHNLLHFLDLRLHEHAQYEIRVYAEAMLELITPIVPETIKIWKSLRDA